MSARRHFPQGGLPPVFAYVGETKELRRETVVSQQPTVDSSGQEKRRANAEARSALRFAKGSGRGKPDVVQHN